MNDTQLVGKAIALTPTILAPLQTLDKNKLRKTDKIIAVRADPAHASQRRAESVQSLMFLNRL